MRKDISDAEKAIVQEWIAAGVLTRSGEGGRYGLGEAIIVTCSEHITHDIGLYAKDSIVIAVNSGAAKLKPHEDNDVREEAIVYRFIPDQINHAINIGCQHCPALPVILIVDIPCVFADDEITNIVCQLDHAILGMRELEKDGCQVSCLLRVSSYCDTVFYSVNSSVWNKWYDKYESEILGRQDTCEEAEDDETFDELPGVDPRR